MAARDTTEGELLALAAAVEADSEHSLARAIVEAVRRRGLSARRAGGFEALPGRGAQTQVDGRNVCVGGPRLLEEAGATVRPEVAETAAAWAAEGRSVL